MHENIIGVAFMFSFFAYQFDIYKWSIFIASSSRCLDKCNYQQKLYVFESRQKILKLALVISLVLMLIAFGTVNIGHLIMITNDKVQDEWAQARNLFVAITFAVFFFIYLGVFFLLIRSLNR